MVGICEVKLKPLPPFLFFQTIVLRNTQDAHSGVCLSRKILWVNWIGVHNGNVLQIFISLALASL